MSSMFLLFLNFTTDPKGKKNPILTRYFFETKDYNVKKEGRISPIYPVLNTDVESIKDNSSLVDKEEAEKIINNSWLKTSWENLYVMSNRLNSGDFDLSKHHKYKDWCFALDEYSRTQWQHYIKEMNSNGMILPIILLPFSINYFKKVYKYLKDNIYSKWINYESGLFYIITNNLFNKSNIISLFNNIKRYNKLLIVFAILILMVITYDNLDFNESISLVLIFKNIRSKIFSCICEESLVEDNNLDISNINNPKILEQVKLLNKKILERENISAPENILKPDNGFTDLDTRYYKSIEDKYINNPNRANWNDLFKSTIPFFIIPQNIISLIIKWFIRLFMSYSLRALFIYVSSFISPWLSFLAFIDFSYLFSLIPSWLLVSRSLLSVAPLKLKSDYKTDKSLPNLPLEYYQDKDRKRREAYSECNKYDSWSYDQMLKNSAAMTTNNPLSPSRLKFDIPERGLTNSAVIERGVAFTRNIPNNLSSAIIDRTNNNIENKGVSSRWSATTTERGSYYDSQWINFEGHSWFKRNIINNIRKFFDRFNK